MAFNIDARYYPKDKACTAKLFSRVISNGKENKSNNFDEARRLKGNKDWLSCEPKCV